MKGRVESLDAFRGFTIVAMILCAAISWDAGLPAWMFHCQTPPPDYAFHPEVRGLTWVDMVFPFFIFALGVAIPFSLGGKLEKGVPMWRIVLDLCVRCVTLLAFSFVLGHNGVLQLGEATPWVKLGIWLLLFLALVLVRSRWLNIVGWALLAGAFAFFHFRFGMELSFESKDVIIWLLGLLSLMAGLIWLLTRKSPMVRVLVWFMVGVLKIIGFDFTQYLMIALPATLVGDFIRSQGVLPKPKTACWLAPVVSFAAVVVQLWSLYTRNVLLGGIITAALLIAFALLTFRQIRSSQTLTGWMGAILLLAGILVDPLEGGLAKDYCNLSYLLVTGGQAALTLYVFMWIESRRSMSRTLVMTGMNPMIAYTVAWVLVSPLLYLVGVLGPLDAASVGHPFVGFLRGVLVTCGMCAVTCLFTKFKLFWKS